MLYYKKGGIIMREYELVREIKNLCPNNQMRDVFFEEVETDDPKAYVSQMLKGRAVSLSAETQSDGVVIVHADCDGLIQKFIFTPV
jgi:hypothetical protein